MNLNQFLMFAVIIYFFGIFTYRFIFNFLKNFIDVYQKYFLLSIATLTVLFGFVIYPPVLDQLTNGEKNDEHLNNGITVTLITLTGLAATYSALETNKQRIISENNLAEFKKQTELSMRPYIRIQLNKPDSKHNKDRVIDVVNIGRGMAKNVEFKPIRFNLEEDNVNSTVIIIKNRPVISADKGCSSVSLAELQDSSIGLLGKNGDYWHHLLDKVEQNFMIEVEYDDLLDKHYKAVFVSDVTYNDQFRIEFQDMVA